MSCSDIFLGLIAVLFPPVAGYVPGLIHAWYIIAKYPERDHDYEPIDAEAGRRRRQSQSGRVTYYYINHEQQQQHQSSSQNQRGYGTQQGKASAKNKPKAPAANKSKAPAKAPANNSSQAGNSSSAAGSSRQPARPAEEEDQGAPPSYSEVVRGDNKIQSQD